MTRIDTFQDYALAVEVVTKYPHAGEGDLTALTYCALGLAGESGEFADKIKKIMRDDDGAISLEKHAALIKELGDVLWYLSRAATELGRTLSHVAEENITKLMDRHARGVMGGSGDNR